MKFSEIIPTFNFLFCHHFEKQKRKKKKLQHEDAGLLRCDAV